MATRRSRRGERGAAMVEAAVVVPFFVIVFLALGYVGATYSAKMRTISEARQGAWTYALANCAGNPPDTSKQDAGPMGSDPNMDPSASSKYGSAPGADTITKGFNMAVSTSKRDVLINGQSGGKTQTVQTTTRMVCNEKPMDGDLHGVLKTAWGILTGW
jgi:Flp pilus assembly protein TadG